MEIVMKALFYRIFSLILRFSCPLLILYISSPEVLGKYYLFVAFFTFSIFLISLETAIPFSRKYLLAKGEFAKRRVFTSFLLSQFVLASLLSVPVVVFYLSTVSMSFINCVLLDLALITGASVNEVGRFFWNIGKGEVASKRDLILSFVFVLSMISAVVFDQSVVSVVSLGILILFNLLVIFIELKKWGIGLNKLILSLKVNSLQIRKLVKRLASSVKLSAPQVVHIQLLSLYPFLERLFLEKNLGLSLVGSYSFQYTLIQAGLGLLLMPEIARVRSKILESKKDLDFRDAHVFSLRLLSYIFGVGLVGVIASYFVVPILSALLKKNVTCTVAILISGLFSSVMSTYTSAVSPLFASKERILISNVLTLLCMGPFFVLIWVAKAALSIEQVMGIITIMAILQLGMRMTFHWQKLNSNALKVEGVSL